MICLCGYGVMVTFLLPKQALRVRFPLSAYRIPRTGDFLVFGTMKGTFSMNKALILLFLFSVGSLTGWVIELFFRRFCSGGRKTKKWVNPGFLVGPCLPLYGTGLTALYLMAGIRFPDLARKNPVLEKIAVIILMMIIMTLIEYITGLIFIRGMHVMLWDYSRRWGNIQGIICPLFTLFWGILGAFYYIFIHPRVLHALDWLSRNLAFSFFIGLFYGVFLIDCGYSFNLVARIRKLADQYQVIVKYNELKERVADLRTEAREKTHFFFSFSLRSRIPGKPAVNLRDAFENGKEYFSVSRFREKLQEGKEKFQEGREKMQEEFEEKKTERKEH